MRRLRRQQPALQEGLGDVHQTQVSSVAAAAAPPPAWFSKRSASRSSHGYNFVVTLPVGAANIDIRQRGYRGLSSDENYLAVRNRHGSYILNGNYVVAAAERDLLVRGGLLRYSGTASSVETLQAVAPLREPLTVELLSVGRMTPPRVRYTFYVAVETKEEAVLTKEGRSHNRILEDSNRVEARNQPSGSRWVAGGWRSCTLTCGRGLQRRAVLCQDAEGRAAADCERGDRPESERACGEPCPSWTVGTWSHCSKSCGRGFKRRQVRCVAGAGVNLPRERCSGTRKPQELDLCLLRTC